jgi:hypothetical protein
VYGMTPEEMKRQHRAKQEQISKLEAERAAILERGEPTPHRLRYRLKMLQVEAEELRMWGNRELTRQLREATKNDEISLSISQHAFRT